MSKDVDLVLTRDEAVLISLALQDFASQEPADPAPYWEWLNSSPDAVWKLAARFHDWATS